MTDELKGAILVAAATLYPHIEKSILSPDQNLSDAINMILDALSEVEE